MLLDLRDALRLLGGRAGRLVRVRVRVRVGFKVRVRVRVRVRVSGGVPHGGPREPAEGGEQRVEQ